MSGKTVESFVVSVPGVYEMGNDEYHADPAPFPSLSSSGAKKLLPPSCPARFKYERDYPSVSSDVFDFGSAAHRMVLGAGPTIVSIDALDWRTNAAKAARDEVRATGGIALLDADYQTVLAMRDAIAGHPLVSALFGNGEPEQSLFWQDEASEVWRRARLDWLPNETTGRMIVADYKTARSAHPETFAKAAADYGYHQQAAWYLDGVKALGLAEDPAFVFVVQEKTAPYLVSVVELDATALRIGRHLNWQAIDIFATCESTDTWPTYAHDVSLVSLPYYYERNFGDI